MDENYSIQAKNLLDNLVDEYKTTIEDIHKIDIVLKQVKTNVKAEPLNKELKFHQKKQFRHPQKLYTIFNLYLNLLALTTINNLTFSKCMMVDMVALHLLKLV